ncbi:ParB/RepB/Spo0J family partition protein [Candidatus Nesciobacter abundans]|uniref:ParB/RepB/Spo0J family partition protein n=1 Tax=Candidatus Nesciobacter abundans TaxID=2601668 RepID=A0A5C0UHB5_9PROT|nr:ParB/RepB/Spo0J family partition protein [Candidatus Nesciobacter abundans]QEK39130.1 ParB/RepB/Spo0J family partition protein [Candidatus Nesciobacter abundans]
MNSKNHRPRIGKGLQALLETETSQFKEISIKKLHPSKFQTRTEFKESEIEELSATIKTNGILQPIIVKKTELSSSNTEQKFEIIAGERRFRAAKLAGLENIPCRVVNWSEEEIIEANLLENIQRSQLNGIEEARAYKKLLDKYSITQEELSKKVGKSRSHIANLVRLLKLPENIQNEILKGNLTVGHGKALLQKENTQLMEEELGRILKENLSVRDIENRSNNVPENMNDYNPKNNNKNSRKSDNAQNGKTGKINLGGHNQEKTEEQCINVNEPKSQASKTKNEDLILIESQISQLLDYTTEIEMLSKSSGNIKINFKNSIDLDDILSKLSSIQKKK